MLLWKTNNLAASAPSVPRIASDDYTKQWVEKHSAQVVLHDEHPQVVHAALFEILEHLIGGQHLPLPRRSHEGVIRRRQ